MGIFNNILGTLSSIFSIGKGTSKTTLTSNSTGLSVDKKLTVPDLKITNQTGMLKSVDGDVVGGANASDIPFTPHGNISATNVQDAIQELDIEKQEVGYTSVVITYTDHGFIAGDIVRRTATNWVKSVGNNETNAEVFGMVIDVIDANNFKVCTEGVITGSFIPNQPSGTVMFLSNTTEGALTSTSPNVVGSVSKPLLTIDVAGEKALFVNMRGITILRQQISSYVKSFNFEDFADSPMDIGYALNGYTISNVALVIQSAFDSGEISVGDFTVNNRLMNEVDSDLTQVHTYQSSPNYTYNTSTMLELHMVGTPTQGQATLIVYMS